MDPRIIAKMPTFYRDRMWIVVQAKRDAEVQRQNQNSKMQKSLMEELLNK